MPTVYPEAMVNSSCGTLGFSFLICKARVTAAASWEYRDDEGKYTWGFSRCPARGHAPSQVPV